MNKKIVIVLIMIIMFSLFVFVKTSNAVSTQNIEITIDESKHIQTHEMQTKFEQKREILFGAYLLLLGIIIISFFVTKKFNNNKTLYYILFSILAFTWFIAGIYLFKYKTFLSLIIEDWGYEPIIGISIIITLIAFIVNKVLTEVSSKNLIIFLYTILLVLIGYITFVVIKHYDFVSKWISILVFTNFSLIPIYVLNKKQKTKNKKGRIK